MKWHAIINNVLTGVATEAEKNALEVWLTQHPDNQAEFDDLNLLWKYRNPPGMELDINGEETWNKIKSKFKVKSDNSKKNQTINRLSLLIAGLLALLVTVVIVQNSNPSGYSMYNDVPVQALFSRLEQEYAITIKTENKAVLTCTFTGTLLRNKDPLTILLPVAEALNLHHELLPDGTHYLRGDGCTQKFNTP